MRINGSMRALTELDDETQSILIYRLHPWINNFNNVVLFLMQYNMDIKFIGSGEVAKALIFYITDYITKATLPTHLGLQALIYAIKANHEKYTHEHSMDMLSIKRSLLIKVVNSLMARNELLQQQVHSYLISGGDSYTSHPFKTLFWGELDTYIAQSDPEGSSSQEEDVQDVDMAAFIALPKEDIVLNSVPADGEFEPSADTDSSDNEDKNGGTISVDQPDVPAIIAPDTITLASLLMDYHFCSDNDAFATLSVWEHVTLVHQLTKHEEEHRSGNLHGRTGSQQVMFLTKEHPLFHSHLSRLCLEPFIPVLLGPSIPQHDQSEQERMAWCRTMLIFFKPW